MGYGIVECHSGYAYAERPIAFYWEGTRLEVELIETEWRIPDGKCFLVRARNGGHFELVFDEEYDAWRISQV